MAGSGGCRRWSPTRWRLEPRSSAGAGSASAIAWLGAFHTARTSIARSCRLWTTAARWWWNCPTGRVILSGHEVTGRRRLGARGPPAICGRRLYPHIDRDRAVAQRHGPFQRRARSVGAILLGAVYVSPVMFNRDTSALGALQAAVERHHVVMQNTSAGDRLAAGDATTIRISASASGKAWAPRKTPIALCWRSSSRAAGFADRRSRKPPGFGSGRRPA